MYTIFKNLSAAALLATMALGTNATAADNEPQARIVGGDAYDISVAPATVALLSRRAIEQGVDFFNAQFCGGTLIQNLWVLTAAHCLVDDNGNVPSADNYSVLVGSTSLFTPTTSPVNVAQVIVHPDYRSTTEGFDIALLKLEAASGPEIAALNTRAIPAGEAVFAAGWGATNAGSAIEPQRFPGTLLGTVVLAIPGAQCNADFPDYNGSVYDSNICAAVPNGGRDACQGDSGGPLYATQLNSDNTLTITSVAGITSWGIGCGDADHPGVYTNVASFINWIETNTNSGGVTPPSTTPVTDVPPNDVSGGTAGLSLADSGSAGGFILSLLTMTLLFRGRLTGIANRRRLPLLAAAFTFIAATAGVQQVQATDTPSDVLTMLGQPIGENRDDIIQGLQDKWQSEPVCTTLRTGVGKTRRAYFLETCTFKNPLGHTLWDATPSVVEYRFLENSLVQMSYTFDEMADAKKFRLCAKEQNETLAKSTDKKLSIKVDDDFRTTLSNVEQVEQIHSLRGTL